jgi:hypothetical protein
MCGGEVSHLKVFLDLQNPFAHRLVVVSVPVPPRLWQAQSVLTVGVCLSYT